MVSRIASEMVNVFYTYLQSQKDRSLIVRKSITGVEMLARDYFEVIHLRKNHSITQIKQEFMPEHIERVYSRRARHHASSDVNVIFSEDINLDSLDGLMEEMEIKFEKRQDQLWLEYIIDKSKIASVHEDCRRVQVYGLWQQTSKGVTYAPHKVALQMLDLIYEELEQRRLDRQQRIKEEEFAGDGKSVLTSHEFGFRDDLPKQRIRPKRVII